MTKKRLIETIQILIIWSPFWICYKKEYDTYGLFGMIIISLIFYYYGLKNEKYKINVNLVILIHIFSILFYYMKSFSDIGLYFAIHLVATFTVYYSLNYLFKN